ncbi:TPA: head-tail adaptor protein [Clostridioides difficile]|nr:head-tail adaptor protein [Clostridioides difficile]HEK4624444.1 head-tail adaptor protein [Clostridioides difficile]HEK4859217.1 head-tail adaptor protein [Clostridioides difficile]
MKKIKFDNFNDGIIEFGEYKESYDIEGNALDEKEFIVNSKLFYSNEYIREQDRLKFDNTGLKVSIKLKVPYMKLIKTSDVIKLNNEFYSIVKLDISNDKTSIYLYLSELVDVLDKHISIFIKERKNVLEDVEMKFYKKVWVCVEDLNSKELIENNSIKTSTNKKFKIRYIEELDLSIKQNAITNFVIKYKDKFYNITQILNLEEENKILEITAESK